MNPSCYTGYTAKEELIDFYQTTADLFATRDTYKILAAAGIVPKTSGTYAASAIQAALTAYHGKGVIINCKGGKFNEVWYHYNVGGSVQTGQFYPAAPVGSGSTCSGNVSYLPKTYGATPTTTAGTGTGTATTAAPTSTSTGVFSGTGTLVATTGGAVKGGLISAGTWYVSGTLANIKATVSGKYFRALALEDI